MAIKGKGWYPKAIRDLVDYDYLDKLSKEEKAWLRKFSDETYGAIFGEDPLIQDPEDRRELWNDKYRLRGDLFGRGLRRGAEVRESDAVGVMEAEPTPDYLRSAEYQAALDKFRNTLPKDSRETVLPGPKFKDAEAQLVSLTHALPSLCDRGRKLARNRLKKLEQDRKVLWNLCTLVHGAQFPGTDAELVVEVKGWLLRGLRKTDKKLGDAGVKPPPGQELAPEVKGE